MRFSEDAALQAAATIVSGVVGRVPGVLDAAEMGKLLLSTYNMVRATERLIDKQPSADHAEAIEDLRQQIHALL